MSTTPQTDSTSTQTPPRSTTRFTQTATERFHTGAPQTFSSTNRKPLPPAFGDETWATGEP